jgi:hypothetical protein
MKKWFTEHKPLIKKWGLVAVVIYTAKALIYISIIVWASIKFVH